MNSDRPPQPSTGAGWSVSVRCMPAGWCRDFEFREFPWMSKARCHPATVPRYCQCAQRKMFTSERMGLMGLIGRMGPIGPMRLFGEVLNGNEGAHFQKVRNLVELPKVLKPAEGSQTRRRFSNPPKVLNVSTSNDFKSHRADAIRRMNDLFSQISGFRADELVALEQIYER